MGEKIPSPSDKQPRRVSTPSNNPLTGPSEAYHPRRPPSKANIPSGNSLDWASPLSEKEKYHPSPTRFAHSAKHQSHEDILSCNPTSPQRSLEAEFANVRLNKSPQRSTAPFGVSSDNINPHYYTLGKRYGQRR